MASNKRRKPFAMDWGHLQRPGFSRTISNSDTNGWIWPSNAPTGYPTPPARRPRNNTALLAYIGGKPEPATSKDHNFRPGETVEKQIIVINNSRETVTGECRWSLGNAPGSAGRKSIKVVTGQQERVPIRIPLPGHGIPGSYDLKTTVDFSTGETQEDAFTMHVLPARSRARAGSCPSKRGCPHRQRRGSRYSTPRAKPARSSTGWRSGIKSVDAAADLSPFDVLIIGKGALTASGCGAPYRSGSRRFESARFRADRGGSGTPSGVSLPRIRSESGVPAGTRSSASGRNLRRNTCVTGAERRRYFQPSLRYEMRPGHGPTVNWCDIPVSHVWRCGNRGNVASVLIEKPACGDFMPIVDGGYSLQYSPLLEYREGLGFILFCQLDVTGRTESDPAAEKLRRT